MTIKHSAALSNIHLSIVEMLQTTLLSILHCIISYKMSISSDVDNVINNFIIKLSQCALSTTNEWTFKQLDILVKQSGEKCKQIS